MCKVDAGSFQFGEGDAAKRVTFTSSFLIDQFEVSAAQAALFLNARGNNDCSGGLAHRPWSSNGDPCVLLGLDASSSAEVRDTDGRFEAVPTFERVSTYSFTVDGAMQYCAWVGKRVPTAAQREYAGRHDPRTGEDYRYPWGNEWLPNHASCWHSSECKAPAQPRYGYSWIGIFDGTEGRGDGTSPWGLHDITGGTDELVFRCDDPEATCQVGEGCSCSLESDYSDRPDVALMAVPIRKTLDVVNSGGLRCAMPFTERAPPANQ